MIILYDYLENVLTYFRDNYDAMEDEIGSNIFRKFQIFKYIYVLYFLADILYILSMLSRLFQNKFVDITTIGSVIETDIVQIRMFFIEETTDLNSETFNEQTSFTFYQNLVLNDDIRGSYQVRLKEVNFMILK